MRKVLFILGELSDLDVEWLTAHGKKEHVSTGTVLIREGQPIDAMYVLLEGRLSVYINDSGKRQLAQLGAGDVVGEMSFVDARPPSATVEALRDSVVLTIRRSDLQEKLKADTGFAARFYRALAGFLSDRLRATVTRLGYGRAEPEEESAIDELDPNLLDSIHLAGARFDRMLKRLMSG
jgi:CRP/FNR family cyclic AMP-dependent transcriptional regulator